MLSSRACAFIGLNIIRILSIVALLLAFSSNVATLANDIKAVNRSMAAGKDVNANGSNTPIDMYYILGSTVPNQLGGVLWAVLNRLLIIFQTIILVLSEVEFPAVFFDLYFPVLGKTFGLGAIGCIQMLIGAAILSHHVDTFTRVSATFLFSIGCLNGLVGLIFRESAKSKRAITAWREDSKSALPIHATNTKMPPFSFSPSSTMSAPPSFISHLYSGSTATVPNSANDFKDEKKSSGFGFGRQGEKVAAENGYLITRPVDSRPRSPKTASCLGTATASDATDAPGAQTRD